MKLEVMFNRALAYSFQQRNFFSFFPLVLLCGFIFVLCKGLAMNTTPWMEMSLTFLPYFLCSGILLAGGIVFIRVYQLEKSGQRFSLKVVIAQSWGRMVGIAYLSLPFAMSFLILWTILGLFYLLKDIPGLGPTISILFASAPFMLVLFAVLLVGTNIFALFLATPSVALSSAIDFSVVQKIFLRLRLSFFANALHFLLALLPFLLASALLFSAEAFAGSSFLFDKNSVVVAFERFFIMFPFCALLTPTILFFFYFAAEKRRAEARRKGRRARRK